MKINLIGKSKIEISSLGMGCWSYGGGKYWGTQSQTDVNAIVQTALDYGINYFDTAEVYNDGESERSLGIALKTRRSNAVIGTKISPTNVRKETLKTHCEKSLSRLNTDYIDIYMLHWPINKKSINHFSTKQSNLEKLPSIEEVFNGLIELQKEGKIREIGISNHGLKQMNEIAKAGIYIAVNELPYNLISRAIEKDILPYCYKNKIAVMGYMALQQGVLAGKYNDFEKIRPSQAHSRHFHFSRGGIESRHGETGAENEIQELIKVIQEISDELNIPFTTVSLAWAMSNEKIANTLVGSRKITQLMMNFNAAEYVLPIDAIRRLNTSSQHVWDVLGNNPDYYENRNDSRIW